MPLNRLQRNDALFSLHRLASNFLQDKPLLYQPSVV